MKCKGCGTEVLRGRACGAGNGLCNESSAYCEKCGGEERANKEMVEHVRLVHGGGIMQKIGEPPAKAIPFFALRDQIIATAMAEWAMKTRPRPPEPKPDDDPAIGLVMLSAVNSWDRDFEMFADTVVRSAAGTCSALDRYLKQHD